MNEEALHKLVERIDSECGIISVLFIVIICILLKVIKTLWEERKEAIETMMNLKGLANRSNEIVGKITTLMEYQNNNKKGS